MDLFGVNPKYVGRPDSATPAVGSTKAHEKQAHALLVQVFPSMSAEKVDKADKSEDATNKSANESSDEKPSSTVDISSKNAGGRKPTANKR